MQTFKDMQSETKKGLDQIEEESSFRLPMANQAIFDDKGLSDFEADSDQVSGNIDALSL